MGCLRNIIRAIILTLAVIGFLSLGGKELVMDLLRNWVNPSQSTMIEKAQKVGDFSNINEEFEIEKATGLMGYNAVVAEHKATGQKMIVVDSGSKSLISAEDLQSENIEEKIKTTIKKVKYQAISVEDIAVTKKGYINSYGIASPYIKFEAKIKKFPIDDISGIVAVAKTNEGKERILISINEREKYSHLISEEFFKQIK
ncbi:MAG: hypothetical protein E7Z93_02550 [Cyanobacteria bacterium SIG32]|nr:hypothetical protein [Cyanobacteria bacterium SIG32]